MKGLRVILAVLLLTAASAVPVLAVNSGTFWVTDGANGTGDARAYDVSQVGLVNFAGVHYNSNCGASCGLVDNTISSIVFSCGVSGVTIDQSDYVILYSLGGGAGGGITYNPNYPAACSNGRIVMNVQSNWASSMSTHE